MEDRLLPMRSTFSLGEKGNAKVNLNLTLDEIEVEVSKTLCFPRKTKFSIPVELILSVNLTSSTKSTANGQATEAFSSYESISAPRHLDCIRIDYAKQEHKTVSRWRWKKIVLRQPGADAGEIVKWRQAIINRIEPYLAQRPKKLLVFINPYGGLGEARQVFKQKVTPLFTVCGIECEVIETERANHALEYIRDATWPHISAFDGVVAVGGDGIFNEIFNGLLRRQSPPSTSDTATNSPEIRIGVIPAGSTDAVALSVHGCNDVESSALHIVFGDVRKIDVAAVYLGETLERYSMTMASYGYFGDLVARSEKNRWMGPKRYDLAGIAVFLKNKGYKGHVRFVEDVSSWSSPSTLTPCTESCSTCLTTSPEEVQTAETVTKEIQGEFMVVTGAHTSCRSPRSPKGVSPGGHLSDGNTDLILVKATSRLNYGRYLLRTGYHNDNPFKLAFVEAHRVREFSFTPQGQSTSYWNIDGEILNAGSETVTVKVQCQRLTVFGRGPPNGKVRKGKVKRRSQEVKVNKTETMDTILIDDEDVVDQDYEERLVE